MTEFKKLTAIIEKLHVDRAQLLNGIALLPSTTTATDDDQDSPHGMMTLEEVHEKITHIYSTIHDIFGRVCKIVLKARETDPNRQIYNELMCKKIDGLYSAYCDAILLMWDCCLKEEDTSTEAGTEGEEEETIHHAPSSCLLSTPSDLRALFQQTAIDAMAHANFKEKMREAMKKYDDASSPAPPSPPPSAVLPPPSSDGGEGAAAPPPPKREELAMLEFLLLAERETALTDFVASDEVPLVARVTSAFYACVRARAAAESWERRVASDLSDVVQFEKSMRELIVADEDEGRRTVLLRQRDEHLHLVLEQERLREERWRHEMQRRLQEHASLERRSGEWRGREEAWADLLMQEVQTLLPREQCAYSTESECREGRRRWVSHVLELVRHISRAPDDPSTRMIRNNHLTFMEHYGHPCFRRRHASTQEDSKQEEEREEEEEGTTCACVRVLEITENILYTIRYRLHYESWEKSVQKRLKIEEGRGAPHLATTSPASDSMKSHFCNPADVPLTPAVPVMRSASVARSAKATVAGCEAPVYADFRFPCGGLASQHRYTSQGFEPYGERMYQLEEPDPMEQSDEWMTWFDGIKALQCGLETVLDALRAKERSPQE